MRGAGGASHPRLPTAWAEPLYGSLLPPSPSWEAGLKDGRHHGDQSDTARRKEPRPGARMSWRPAPRQGHGGGPRWAGDPHLLGLIVIGLLAVLLLEFCPLFEGFLLWAAQE